MLRLLTDQDADIVGEYLKRHALETVLLASNMARCGLRNDRMSRRAGDYYGYFLNNQLQGLVAFYNLGSVVPHCETLAAISAVAAIMSQRRFEVVAGMKKVVEPLVRALTPSKQLQSREDSYYLINRTLPGIGPTAEQIVDAGAVRRSEALKFIVEAYRLGFKRRFNLELAAKLLDDRDQGEDFLFFVENGVPKAQAMIQSATGQVTQIAGVYTAEHCRGKGYCKQLVAELCRRSIREGKIPTLMVKKDNIPAVRAYRALGFINHDDYLLIKYVV